MLTASDIYGKLCKIHTKTIEAFEQYENHHDSSMLISVLDEWKRDIPEGLENIAVQSNDLRTFENKLFTSYSPYELTKESICLFRDSVFVFLSKNTNDDILEQDNALLISRLLFNCQLLMECFFPLYESVCTNHIEYVLNRLNVCIAISQSDYFSEYFRHLLFSFNEEFSSIKTASAHIYHVIGVLNFKCHNYNASKSLFNAAIVEFEKDEYCFKDDEYFQTRLLLAYCHEYSHDFPAAIKELVGLEYNKLIDLYKQLGLNTYDLLDVKDKKVAKESITRFIFESLKSAIQKDKPNALFLIADKRDALSGRIVGDKHEILHSLAHCLNELGIKQRIENAYDSKYVRYLLSVARAIMLYVAELNDECRDFQTCLYMIYGEAKDYDVCLKRLRQLLIEYNSSKDNVNYEMENMFYLFLVLNQANKTIEDESLSDKEEAEKAYTKFVNFAKRRFDYDALIHIEIFKFRFEIINILISSFDDEEILKKFAKLKNSDVGQNMYNIKPSTKLNQWIIQEYNKTIALYEFLLEYFEIKNIVGVNELYNFASRFEFFRNIFSKNLAGNATTKIDKIDRIVSLVIDDFISPQSIFLLAPITTSIPYQHQKQNLTTFEKFLFDDSETLYPEVDKMGAFTKLNSMRVYSVDVMNIKWLFEHREYNVGFVAYGSYNDRYKLCLRNKKNYDIYERPILNTKSINSLLTGIKHSRKLHKICKNGQQSCCTTLVTSPGNKKTVIDICNELMISYEHYKDKHFIFFSKGQITPNSSWYLIALDFEPCPLQLEEIAFMLCGNQIEPSKKLAVSNNDSCYVSFGITDAAIVKNDLIELQDRHKVRFWYDKNILEDGDWSDCLLDKMKTAKCVLMFASIHRIQKEQDVFYRELLFAAENKLKILIVQIGFEDSMAFISTVRNQLSKMERIKDIIGYLSSSDVVIITRRNSSFNNTDHLADGRELIGKLIEYGVTRNGK
jgi:hypothetical protein